ncbi:hypothetical protein NLX83_15490 [Allokutzneria sp. A3M-2-11 16]|uniref:DddA-like double-stranded DNA deaminase toxin n=1 Tax=Allokutzneria sp. A3M-2-11 16 TaxID=2962043 RepID=UPI0020B65FBD|nr:DddA-like double-stranded DNA deaminase toxin [Allokutzneria sp. A3M-2-11 16]MCP3800670.1 hypothetical protein [Allokutzneria sp. A3M-2-11 16]
MPSYFSEVASRLIAARNSLSPAQLRELARRIRDELRPALAQVVQGSQNFELDDALGIFGKAADGFEQAADNLDCAAERVHSYLADTYTVAGTSERVSEPENRGPARRGGSIPHPSTLPPTLMADSLDPEWARAQQAKLLDRPDDSGPTTGLVFFTDLSEGVITSGAPPMPRPGEDEPDADRADRELINAAGLILTNSEHFPETSTSGSFAVQTHVETKTATLMRQRGLTYAAAVINNRSVCEGERSCRVAVAAILPIGYTLVIWERGADEPVVIQGKARP